MNPFKFLTNTTHPTTQFAEVRTWDTNTTYNIPLDIISDVLTIGLEHHESNWLFRNGGVFLHNHTVVNEMGIGAMYQYKITDVINMNFIGNNGETINRIRIDFSVRFPDEEEYYNFRTIQRLR
jgi:hypothetical protein